MQNACMNKHIHVRDFDGRLHAVLEKRAKARGLSLSQFVRDELARIASTSPISEALEELINLPREQSKWKKGESARVVRASRDERDEHFDVLFAARERDHKKAS